MTDRTTLNRGWVLEMFGSHRRAAESAEKILKNSAASAFLGVSAVKQAATVECGVTG